VYIKSTDDYMGTVVTSKAITERAIVDKAGQTP
jgi:hypothetical protein